MSTTKEEYTSVRDYLNRRASASHIDTNNIESVSYNNENTGSISELTTYLHGSVRNILHNMDVLVNAFVIKKHLQHS